MLRVQVQGLFSSRNPLLCVLLLDLREAYLEVVCTF